MDTNSKIFKISDKLLPIFALLSLVLAFIPLRHIVLCSDDSISNFIYARMTNFDYSYDTAFEFGLMRGKASYLFPLVICFRDFVFRNGNYTSIWLLQYIPTLINVVLTAYLISRKASKEIAYLFVIFFSSLLQINGWHSLITSYPLEFMFGFGMEIIGLILFDIYLNSDKSQAIKITILILSMFCFYEGMQSYEAFLLFAIAYAYMVWFCKAKPTIKDKIISLLPHFVVGVIYLGIFIYLNNNPVVASNGYDIIKSGTIKGLFVTDLAFAFGMFPLSNIIFPSVFKGISLADISLRLVLLGVLSALATYVVLSKKQEDSDGKNYLKIGALGGIIAIVFPLMHSYTSKYQEWVLDEHQFGYIPSTISYFGWITLVVCVLCFINQKYSGNKTYRKFVQKLICIIVFIATILTGLINSSIRVNGIGPTSGDLSLRAQAMYLVACDETFAKKECELLYAPEYFGVHGTFQDNRYIIQYETNNDSDIYITNEISEFDAYRNGYNNPCVFRFDRDTSLGVLFDLNSDEILVVAPIGGIYHLEIESDTGTEYYDVSLKSGETITIDASFSQQNPSFAVTTEK